MRLRAAAFKKARDALLGAAGAHSVLRLCVERAVSHDLGYRRRGEDDIVKENEDHHVIVSKGELIFVEAGGVETLVASPSAGRKERTISINREAGDACLSLSSFFFSACPFVAFACITLMQRSSEQA